MKTVLYCLSNAEGEITADNDAATALERFNDEIGGEVSYAFTLEIELPSPVISIKIPAVTPEVTVAP